jgi:hypothetical protein
VQYAPLVASAEKKVEPDARLSISSIQKGGHKPWPEVIVGFLVGAISLVSVANDANPTLPFDDAYIAFAYASRLAGGHGLRLSVGSNAVEGFSDPLWVFILAVGKWLGISIPTWSIIVNIIFIGLLAGFTMRLVRRLAPALPIVFGIFAAVLVAFVPATAYDAVGGLETLLFAALLAIFILYFLRNFESRKSLSVGSSTLCVLLALTRPEGILVWLSAWAISWLWQRAPRAQLSAAAWFVVPMVLLELGRVLYFHQLLPNTVIAKSGAPLAVSKHAARLELSHFAKDYWPILFLAVVVVAAALIRRRWIPLLLPIIPVIGILFCFEIASSSSDNYPYQRYLFLTFPLWVAAAIAGTGSFGWPTAVRIKGGDDRRPVRRSAQGGNRRIFSGAVVVLVVLGTFLSAYSHQDPGTTTNEALDVASGLSRIPNLFRQDALANHGGLYMIHLASLLNRIDPPGSLIALDEIGYVSYYSHDDVLDLYGLANTHIAHLPGLPGARSDPRYVFSLHPRHIAVRIVNCLCVGFPDDESYINSPAMFGYHLQFFVYSTALSGVSHTVVSNAVSAALFTENPTGSTIISLDNDIAQNQRQRTALPATLQTLLNSEIPTKQDVATPTRQLRAAGVIALRSAFTAVPAGASVILHVQHSPRSKCSVVATAYSPGSAQPQNLQLQVIGDTGKSDVMRVSLGRTPNIESASLPLPKSGAVTIQLESLGADAVAQWAEPRLECKN